MRKTVIKNNIMAKQLDLDTAYLKMAEVWSRLSHANRMKVGALIVKDGQIISDGYNGTPTGTDNACEGEDGKTICEVLHAETNALMKLARSSQSSAGATLYITLSPCFNCAKLIYQAGITRVVCGSMYSDVSGINFLEKLGVKVVIRAENMRYPAFNNNVKERLVRGY